jgi:hypothetical protein
MKQKTLITVTLLIASIFTVSSQTKRLPYELVKGVAECDTVYTLPDVKASFPGGTGTMYSFFKNNLEYSDELTTGLDFKRRIMLQLLVDNKGKILQTKVITSISSELDNDAMNTVKKAPDLNPAVANGKEVCSYLIIPLYYE